MMRLRVLPQVQRRYNSDAAGQHVDAAYRRRRSTQAPRCRPWFFRLRQLVHTSCLLNTHRAHDSTLAGTGNAFAPPEEQTRTQASAMGQAARTGSAAKAVPLKARSSSTAQALTSLKDSRQVLFSRFRNVMSRFPRIPANTDQQVCSASSLVWAATDCRYLEYDSNPAISEAEHGPLTGTFFLKKNAPIMQGLLA